MDRDGDKIHDAIWLAIDSELYDWVDAENTISVIVDLIIPDISGSRNVGGGRFPDSVPLSSDR